MSKEMQTLRQNISERVGKELIDLFPDDQWQQIVDQEIKDFTNNKLRPMVKEMIAEEYRRHAWDYIQQNPVTSISMHVETQGLVRELLNNAVRQNPGMILAALLEPTVRNLSMQMENALSQPMNVTRY